MNSKSITSIYAIIAIVMGFYIVGLFMPAVWNWSVFALPGLSLMQTAFIGMVLIVLFIKPLSVTLYRIFASVLESVSRSLDQLPMIGRILLWIGIPFTLLYLLRPDTFIYGDSQNLIGGIVSGKISSPFYNRIGMLMQLLAKPFNLVGGAREAAANYLQILSILAGIVFIVFSWKTMKLFIKATGDAAVAFLAVITSGIIVIFAGYIEVYSIMIAWLSVYVYYSVLHLRGEGKSSILVILFAVGIFWHFWFIAFFPSLIYVLNQRFKFIHKKILFIMSLAFIAAIYFAGLFVHKGEFPLTVSLLPSAQSNYWLFSPAHLLDFANQLVIIGPLLALLALFPAIFHKDETLNDSHKFLLWAGLPSLAITFMIDPHLGAARDWDLLSIFAVPLIILGVLFLLENQKPVLKFLLVAVLLFNVVHTGSILAANKKKEYAIDRVIKLAYDDPHYQKGYYGGIRNVPFATVLGNGYHRYSDAIPFLKRPIETGTASPNDVALMANYCFFTSSYKDAVTYFDAADGKVPFYPQEISEYGYSLYFAGEYKRAIEKFRIALGDSCLSREALYMASSFAYNYELDSCKKYCDLSISCAPDSIQAMHKIVLRLPGWVFPQLKAQYESRVLAAHPDAGEVRNNLIKLFQQAGMPDSASYYMNYKDRTHGN